MIYLTLLAWFRFLYDRKVLIIRWIEKVIERKWYEDCIRSLWEFLNLILIVMRFPI